MTTLNLAEITQNFQALEALMEESAGEVTPDIEAWFAEYDLALSEKVDGYALYIRSLEEQAEGIKRMEAQLAAKRKTLTNRAELMMSRVENFLIVSGRTEVRGGIYKFAFQKNGGAEKLEVLVPPETLPEGFKKVTYAADQDAIRQHLAACAGRDLKDGEGRVIAMLMERGRSLRLR